MTSTWFQDSLINLREVGDYKLCGKIIASLDQNISNDSACWNFSVIKSFDLALDSIVFPDKVNFCYHNIEYKPMVKATNLGLQPIVNTLVEMRIYKSTNIYWQKELFIDLDSGESKWLTFDNTLNPLKFDFVGIASARAVGYLTLDRDKTNDTTFRTFNVAEFSAIRKIEMKNFVLYPNPTTGLLYIETPDNSTHDITIWNTSSQKVYSNEIQPSAKRIELDLKSGMKLGGGVYFIQVENSNSKKLFKLVVY